MPKEFIDKLKNKGFKLTKERIWRYLTQTITDSDHADDIALLANIRTQAETLLERALVGISHHDNADMTEYMSFNQSGDISSLNGSSLKPVDKFIYLGSSVS